MSAFTLEQQERLYSLDSARASGALGNVVQECQGRIIFIFNIPDALEGCGVFESEEVYQKIISQLKTYTQRAMMILYFSDGYAYIPEEIDGVHITEADRQLIAEMISASTGESVDSIQARIVTRFEAIMNMENAIPILFASKGENYEALKRSGKEIDNAKLSQEGYDGANSKSFLQDNFGEYMAPGKNFSIGTNGELTEECIQYIWEIFDRDGKVVIRASHGVSGFGMRKFETPQSTDLDTGITNRTELEEFLSNFPKYYQNQPFPELLVEQVIQNIHSSPSIQVTSKAGMQIVGAGRQDLDGNQHKGNEQILDRENNPLVQAMEEIAKKVAKKYYEEFGFEGAMGLDFILSETNEPEKKYKEIRIGAKTYYLYLVEVNARFTGAWAGILLPHHPILKKHIDATNKEIDIYNGSISFPHDLEVYLKENPEAYHQYMKILLEKLKNENCILTQDVGTKDVVNQGRIMITCPTPKNIQCVFIGNQKKVEGRITDILAGWGSWEESGKNTSVVKNTSILTT